MGSLMKVSRDELTKRLPGRSPGIRKRAAHKADAAWSGIKGWSGFKALSSGGRARKLAAGGAAAAGGAWVIASRRGRKAETPQSPGDTPSPNGQAPTDTVAAGGPPPSGRIPA